MPLESGLALGCRFPTFYLCDFPEHRCAISVRIFIRKKLVTVKHTISIRYYCQKKGQEPIKMIRMRNMKYIKYKRGKSAISEGYSWASSLSAFLRFVGKAQPLRHREGT